MRSHAVGGCLIFFGLFYTAYAQNPQNNSCSIGILSCDPRANCTEIGDNSFTCICPFGLSGDGFRNGTGCGLPPCDFTSQCHPHADCIDSVCKCKTGFTQNLTDCFDIDECSENPCSPHASCENTEGSFSCACNQTEGYLGNGFTCQHVCSVSADCTGSNEICVGFECVCAIGYHRSSNDTCVNINECELNGTCNGNATCTDTVGSFTCQCINGFRGDGFTCTAIPKNCHEIKMADPSAESAEYLIDPDGTGPLDEIMVECEMRPDLGITIISPIEDEYKVKTSRTTFNVNYEPSLDHIVSVIQASTYCYQSMSYQCQWGAKLLNLKNDLYYNDYWLDRHSNPQYTWGGAKTTGDCACGGLGYCENPDSKCNCDGSTNSKRVDNGKETDKAKLPILRVVSQPDKGNGQIKIGAVNCAPKSFDVPRDCHEAKFNPYYLITRNGPQLLDFDGPEGPLEPVQAHCDMETYDHVGITVIPHEDRIPKEPEGGTNPINYKVIENATEALVNISEFCYQEVRYNCNNSRLQNNGDMKGFFSGPDGVPRDYFPGGMNQQYKCACGLTGTCASDNYGCNCDVNDGVLRSDFGPVVNSSDLPITSLTFLEVGPGHWGEYFVGPLMCSQRQFGIPATCSGYVHQEYTEDHTYLIDPDGAPDPEKPSEENVDFFPAFCEFHDDYAVTVIPTETDQENQTISITGSLLYSYRLVTNAQLKVLIERAVFCTQAITYKCTRAPIHVGYSNHVTWTTKDGNEESYFAGDGWEDVCECGLLQNCFNGFPCNCDANDDQEREDSGLLLDKWDLPIMQVNFMQLSGSASVSVGPMRCSDLFPNCFFMKKFMKNDKVPGTPSWANGMKTIDPDGAGGVEAFKVICEGSITRVPAEPDPTEDTNSEPLSPVTKCYDITYQVNGQNISSDQLQALVDASKHCKQELTMKCFNAQITNHVNYSKCNGDTIPGWAGSKGAPMCACGITGTCVQGEPNCNCDLEDGKLRNDTGWITDIELLPVCHICVTLDPAEHVNSTLKYRNATTIVSALVCNNKALTGGVGKCQDLREQGVTASGTYQLDPDGYKGTPYFSVYCRFEAFPPVGFVEIFPKEPVVEIPPNGTDVMIYYYVQEMVLLKKLISLSGSCTQTIHIECVNASLTFNITNQEGWYDVKGNYHSNWIGNKEDNEGCTGGQCNCNLGGIQFDGGVITDKDLLPVTRIKIGHISEASGLRKAFIGKIICHDLFPTCDAIKKARKNKNPFGHNIYTIDADQEGPVPHFAVKCDFRTDESLGITIINTDNKITFVKNVVTPGGIPKNITYQTVWPGDRENITYEQAHALATVSGFCYQGIKYICYNSPLINSSDTTPGYYSTYDDVQSLSFGVAGHSDTVGCPCVLLDTCPANHICHCDEMEAFARDYGHETNRSNLPIITVNFGGQTAPIAVATYQISDMRCGPKPFDLPKHCDDAYQNYGFDRSGEVLIWPHVDGSDDYIEPYLVYCDMNHLVRGGGVTIIKHNLPANSNVTYNETVVLTYKDATHEQVKKMVDLSLFCKQPFKYECINTKFENFFSWRGGTSDDDLEYVGFGRYNLDKTECNCGEQGLCGGSENRDILVALKRGCNCDSADNLTRADAGIFRDKHLLQIREITFTDPDVPGASGTLTLGPLYCSETDFEINECTSGFHDCHEKAVCKNIVGGSYECRCLPGYRAIGVPDFWANGRNCYDNDECAAGHYCPSMSSNCTNTDGSFYCTCLDGYHQTGPQTCIDIDECTEETNSTPCDENAKCINVDGSYHCMCNRGYRGNGFECAPVSICACFGDPHCYSLDDRLLTFMGACQYVMATDDCETNPNEPLFEVLSTFTRRDFPAHVPVSWVKDVTVKVYNYTIHLRRDEKVLIDNVLTNLPWRKENVSVVLSGRYIKVFTEFGVQVNWDMVQLVEVYVPGQWKEKVCGLCGNYNDNATDDWILGPQCPQPNTTFVNNANLFGDSWSVPEYIADNPVCTPNCTEFNDTDPCTGDRLQMAEIVCEPIFGQNQKFKKCLEELNEADETFVLALKEFCIKDACAVEDDLSVVVCRVAEQMYEFCKTRYNIIVDYRDEHFCPKDCEDNKVHSDCGPEAPLTCLDILTNSTPSTDGCAEGCFCPEGMVLDTDKCVNESGCGCLFDGRYYPIGAKVVRNECDEKGICLGNNQFNFTDIDCHDNATCDNRDGIIDCHCNEGFYGNGVDECKPDPCSPNPCNVSEDCLRDNTTDRGYVCLCADGYSGDCDNCKDVDECLTGTHDCKPNQHCKNTDGSFVCECEEGYIYLQGICQDINECRPPGNRSDPCGDNSKCMNLIGTYECPCCQGFEKNETGDCVETDAEPTEEQPYCCTCEIAICDREGQVCSEDGKTYDNMRDMIISRCEEGLDSHKWIAVDYFSKCKGSCSKVQCPKYQYCIDSGGKPKCECDKCTPEEIIIYQDKVCTEHRIIYENFCVFKEMMCKYDYEYEIELLTSIVPCEKGSGNSPVGPWGEPGPCSVNCGLGVQTRTRQANRNLTTEEQQAFPLTHEQYCFLEQCEDGPCFNFTCPTVAHVCDVVDNTTAECICPPMDPLNTTEVCGYIMTDTGPEPAREWHNAGYLRRHACKNNAEDYVVMNEGECGDEPPHCTPIPHRSIYSFNHSQYGNCNTTQEINWYECAGGCDNVKEWCCHSKKEAEVTQPESVNCDEADEELSISVTLVQDCECQDIEIVHGSP